MGISGTEADGYWECLCKRTIPEQTAEGGLDGSLAHKDGITPLLSPQPG